MDIDIVELRRLTKSAALGPWHYYACNGVIEIHNKDFGVVVKWPGFDGSDYSAARKLANAILIAAAPELLAEVERLRAIVDSVSAVNLMRLQAEIERLRAELAAAQAREKVRIEALRVITARPNGSGNGPARDSD